MTLLRPLALVLLAATLAGACAGNANPPNALTPEGEKVQVAARVADLPNCRSVGVFVARASSVFGKVDVTEDQTVDARNKAAKLGGNRVVRREATQPVGEPGTHPYEAFLCE